MWPSGLIFFVIGSDIQVIFHSEMAVLLNLIRLLFMTELFVFFFFLNGLSTPPQLRHADV